MLYIRDMNGSSKSSNTTAILKNPYSLIHKMRYEIKGEELTIFGSLEEYGVRGMTFEVDPHKYNRRMTQDSRIKRHFKEHHELPENIEGF